MTAKAKRDVDDILTIYTALDCKKCLLPIFAVTDTARIPSLRDFDMTNFNTNLNKKFVDFEAMINDKLTQVNTSILTCLSSSFKDVSDASIKSSTKVEESITQCTEEIKQTFQQPLDTIISSVVTLSTSVETIKKSVSGDDKVLVTPINDKLTQFDNWLHS